MKWQGPILGPIRKAFQTVLTNYWAWREGPTTAHAVQVGGLAPSDSLQVPMNLVMPLRDTTAVGRANAMAAIGASIQELFVGLDNVGTVHFARFDIVDGNLCMMSIFDGDPRGYIRDFIALFGNVFDALMEIVVDPPTTPCEEHVDEFLDWIMAHDAFQIPGAITEEFPGLKRVANAPRDLVLAMHEQPNVQLGIYRGYPGFSAAQVRDRLGVGW
ncbi:MAG: hypothetical protein AAFY28_11415 [Actinomycetota bacterium]